MNKLFNDSDSDEEVTIKTNNSYAQNYDTWRGKEELNKFKVKYGRDVSLSDLQGDLSSSSEEEDEDAVELTEEAEKDFYKTLSCLKNKDPRIYDGKVQFFHEKKQTDNQNKKKDPKEKPFTVKDAERQLILEKGGIYNEDEPDDSKDTRPISPTYVEEQRQLRENLVKALNDDDEENDAEWGGLFKKREKTKQEKDKEEEAYKQWLDGQPQVHVDKEQIEDLKGLKDYWSDPKLAEDEKFLKDYMLNKRYLDKDDPNYIPTYEEVVHDSDEGLSEDEKNIEVQEEFEHKYNFRFEEPDQDFLKRYPRTMEHSVRKKDNKRKEKRAEVKERKLEEKERKKEELNHLKALKRKEIEAKLQQLKEITGNDTVGFQDDDVDGDFDAEAYDERMKKIFNDEYYGIEADDQKPTFPEDDDLDIEGWDNWKKEDYDNGEYINEEEPHCEDDNFNMDCDYDPAQQKRNVQSELIENSKGRKKRRRKNKFVEVLMKEKPVFDATNNKSYEEYIDEYYKLDYEDIIGDLPCRFKYRKTEPNSFGLSIEEILYAKDKELNSWCSLKKAVQIRPENVERYEVNAYAKKAQNELLKRRTFRSLYHDNEEEENNDEQESNANEEPKKKLSKNQIKKLKKRKLAEKEAAKQSDNTTAKKRKVEKENDDIKKVDVSAENYEPSNKKKKHSVDADGVDKIDDVKVNNTIDEPQNSEIKLEKKEEEDTAMVDVKKKKKKNKKKEKTLDPNNDSQQGDSKDKVTENDKSELHNEEINKKIKKEKLDSNNDSQQGVSKDKVKENDKSELHNKQINKKKKKMQMTAKPKSNDGINLSEGRLRAYGINPKKFRNKQKFSNVINNKKQKFV